MITLRKTAWASVLASTLVAIACCSTGSFARGEDSKIEDQIAVLVEQLNADKAADREKAQKELIELGLKGSPNSGDAFLDKLPKPNDQMPQEVQARLAHVASEVRSRMAKQAIEATHVTLDVKEAPLAEVLEAIEKQTGNHVIDYREKFGQEGGEKKITVKVDNEPFWSAMDKVLDAAQMSPYAFSGEDMLALVDREPGVLRRAGRAVYSGPFRIEATNVSAQRGLRSPDQSSLRLELEISWEPRLKPIALTQAAEDLKAVCDDGREAPPPSQDAVFDVEVDSSAHASEVTLPLQLPARTSQSLKTVAGKFTALVPGRIVALKWDKLAGAKEVTQQAGGISVTLERVVKNQALWELHMRVRIDEAEPAIESHRSWVFQNLNYLADKNGERLDNAGFETTMQNEKEAGFAYLFELPEGRDIGDYTWVYRTPASIVTTPVEYTLEDVPLP
jgi:hypothetical protein